MAAPPFKLSLQGIRKSFISKGSALPVLDGVDINVAQGGFLSVIGPSGCGKTTVFNIIAGLLE
ncbi:ATP-binding cassette domain-containing protein, partial [Polaromonas sp. UBA4122]|uniref:ATP-binding cassette domain-containing protein n=1 Tax=Polaromonas sp. UBA4122 TaxID=1947074 RepID=UPI0025DBE705